MFAKVEVNGDGAHPLYRWLKAHDTQPDPAGEIAWNFGKFLVGKDGAVTARFSPNADPLSDEVVNSIEGALSA